MRRSGSNTPNKRIQHFVLLIFNVASNLVAWDMFIVIVTDEWRSDRFSPPH
ncbi:uncharacterized, partial [Tachysurus ichikawai]